MNVTIIDDVLPASMADSIEATLFSPTFPWYYTDDITYDHGSRNDLAEMSFGFFHLFQSEYRQLSMYGSYFESVVHIALDKAGLKIKPDILQGRSFLQVPSVYKREYNNKHVDTQIPHTVVLYYVNDSDGDTFLFEGVNIFKRITPKKNRVVIFDGSIYHSSSGPTLNKRAVLNFDVTSIEG